jgi:hypothetical protein
MLVHVQIAASDELEIETAVARDLFEHVIEETYTSINVCPAAAIEIELHADVGLFGFTM